MPIIDVSRLQTFTAVNLLTDPGAIGGPVVVPSCAQILLNWTLDDGKVAHNVLYGRYTGAFAGSQAQANAIFAALNGSAQWTALAAFLCTTVNFTSVTIRDVNTPNNALISSNTASKPGTTAGTPLPSEVAVVISLRTAQAGRGFRGRTYVPGYSTSALGAGNIVAPAAVTATLNWAQTFFTALSGSGYTWVLGQKARAAYVSPKTGVSHPARPATSTVIAAVNVDNHWDSQRKRGLK